MTLHVAIVVCGPQLEVALASSERKTASLVRLAGVSPRSTLLLAAVDLLTEDAGLAPGALEHILVSRGPGSFTGIRAGIATARGLCAATGATATAFDSLLVQAARCPQLGEVWAAQPGRRGEVYARPFRTSVGEVPEPTGEIVIRSVADLAKLGPWIAPESLSLGDAHRVTPERSAAEALLVLAARNADPQPLEPLYFEGPPIHTSATS